MRLEVKRLVQVIQVEIQSLDMNLVFLDAG